jgi:O-Antigen ligase
MNVLIGRVVVVLCALYFAYSLLSKTNTRNYLLLFLYMFPVMDYTMVPGIYGAFQLMDFLNLFSLILLFSKTNPPKIKPAIYMIYAGMFFVFTGLILAGALISEFKWGSLLQMAKFFPIFIYVKFLIDECFNDPSFIHDVIKILRLTCFIAMIFLAIQLVVGLQFTYYEELNQNAIAADEGGRRYPGFFQDSQANAQFMAMSSFLFLFSFDEKMKVPLKNFFYFMLVVIAMFLTGGRSGLGGFIIGMAVLFLLAGRKYVMLLAGVVVCGVIIVVFLSDYFLIFNRQEGVGDSFNTRYELWERAYEIFKNNPLFGIGIGNYLDFVMIHDQEQYAVLNDEIIYFLQPENGYLKLLTEFGIIAFSIFMLFILIPVVRAIVMYLRNKFDHQVILLIASLISWLVAFNTVYSILDKRIFILVATLTCLALTYPKKQLSENE